ncbi:YeiH family protein [Halovivax gelatinilyticus]|uniref:YeiH family protein n=1 Tax=Halovivax gelatinilyticus TaxID=2961597 RepID=UPI0020CA5D44|nr:putative sulfate exporter family transporter [Halovivax gelatinilyticus]
MIRRSLSAFAPGLALLGAIAVVASALASLVGVTPILLSILLGLVLGNTVSLSPAYRPGIETHTRWLEAGIVLLGATIAVDQIAASGVALLALIVGVVCCSILLVEVLTRVVFGLKGELPSLLAAGMSVCGVSAVVAVAGAIRADERTIAYVVTGIVLFDTITLFAYPVVGTLLGLPDRVFGIWAGVSMLSTGPATAAGFTYSTEAGEWATLTKLTRNALIGFVALAYAMVYAREATSASRVSHLRTLWETLPTFVVGFTVLLVLSAMGLFSDRQVEILETTYTWLFVVAFAGLGLSIRARQLRTVGVTPIAIMAVGLATISALSLGVVFVVFGG